MLAKANINVDDPRWLREVPRLRVHQQFYTNRWADFAKGLQGRTPTAQEVARFAQQLEQEYIQKFGSALYRQGQGLPGQFNVIKLRPDRFPEVAFQAGFGLIRCGCMLKSDPDNLSGLG